ncbi:MAG: tRNA pseudouridine(38-40) synthase TruA [Verrucomicrobiaceae bacterium]|nr:MAG: tRNA pseudouridine(38-40) synthase TruA [Verrucomicrobiaceae bacterium]
MEMLRFKLTLAYDGTAYHGWQAKKDGSAVQNRVETALGRLFASAPKVESSSRTDSGVHARGMVAHVDVPREEYRMPPGKLALAMNALLPEDIRVRSAVRVKGDFHARFDAKGKQYRYSVWNAPVMDPLRRGLAWHVARPLDLEAMREAAAFFVGRHDFRSFTANRGVVLEDAVRTVTGCEIRKNGPQLTFIIEGGGFLYKMCRGIVGTLVQVGEGKFPPGEVTKMLEQKDRRVAGVNAPAHGLVLWKVFYHQGG